MEPEAVSHRRIDPFGEFMGLNDTNMGPFVTRAILLQHIQL